MTDIRKGQAPAPLERASFADRFRALFLDPAFRALAEQMPALIYRACIAPPHRTLYVSPFVSQLGMTPQQWMASPDAWVGAMHPDDRERTIAYVEATVGQLQDLQPYRQILLPGGGA